jgi:hypothetical protein
VECAARINIYLVEYLDKEISTYSRPCRTECHTGTASLDQQQFSPLFAKQKAPRETKLLLILPVQHGHAEGVGTRNVKRFRHACGASNKELLL